MNCEMLKHFDKVIPPNKLVVTRKKHLIYIVRAKDGKKIRYNLKEKSLQRQDKNGEWYCVETQYNFFYGYSIGRYISGGGVEGKGAFRSFIDGFRRR